MSREAYAPPTLQPSSSNFNATTTDIAGPTTRYTCGECNAKVHLKKGDPIRCSDCGHRVLLKDRTKRMVQFEAR
ncbi:DNA-directed RNA polymerases I, II, and III subunit RPABC4 [Usnea florida]